MEDEKTIEDGNIRKAIKILNNLDVPLDKREMIMHPWSVFMYDLSVKNRPLFNLMLSIEKGTGLLDKRTKAGKILDNMFREYLKSESYENNRNRP